MRAAAVTSTAFSTRNLTTITRRRYRYRGRRSWKRLMMMGRRRQLVVDGGRWSALGRLDSCPRYWNRINIHSCTNRRRLRNQFRLPRGRLPVRHSPPLDRGQTSADHVGSRPGRRDLVGRLSRVEGWCRCQRHLVRWYFGLCHGYCFRILRRWGMRRRSVSLATLHSQAVSRLEMSGIHQHRLRMLVHPLVRRPRSHETLSPLRCRQRKRRPDRPSTRLCAAFASTTPRSPLSSHLPRAGIHFAKNVCANTCPSSQRIRPNIPPLAPAARAVRSAR